MEEWFAAFDAGSILLVRSEDLFTQPEATLARLCTHIGMPAAPVGERTRLRKVNAGDGTTALPSPVRGWLDQYFAGPNRRLAELSQAPSAWPTADATPA